MNEKSDALVVPVEVTMRRPTLFGVPAMPILAAPLRCGVQTGEIQRCTRLKFAVIRRLRVAVRPMKACGLRSISGLWHIESNNCICVLDYEW
jgi:hypothetical protein